MRRRFRLAIAVSLAVVATLVVGSSASASAAPHRQTFPRALPDPVPCEGCWAPDLATTWQWQLQGEIDTSVDVQMYDVDGFETPARHRGGAA